MICERCKIREANIRYTEVVNGVKTEHNLCSQCAKEMDFGPYSAIFDGEFPLAKLISSLLGVGEEELHEQEDSPKIVCPTCKTSYEELVKNSCFGCADCYGVFDLLVNDSIKQMQGSGAHVGKKPLTDQVKPEETDMKKEACDAKEQEIRILQAKLLEAVKEEEYELAARYRDQIKEIKEGKETDGEMV